MYKFAFRRALPGQGADGTSIRRGRPIPDSPSSDRGRRLARARPSTFRGGGIMSAASTLAPASPLSVRHRPVEPRTEPAESKSSQCMQALARANEVRLARAALKREIGAGNAEVAEVVQECPWQAESMTL